MARLSLAPVGPFGKDAWMPHLNSLPAWALYKVWEGLGWGHSVEVVQGSGPDCDLTQSDREHWTQGGFGGSK